jgi:hypothetical protein
MGKKWRMSSYIRRPFHIYSMTLQLLYSEFPYIGGKLDFLFLSVQLYACRHSLFTVSESSLSPLCGG